MPAVRTPFRLRMLRLVPLLGILLALSVLGQAAHQHHDGAARHDHCAVCTAGHSPVVSTDVLRAPVRPALLLTRIVLPASPAPRHANTSARHGRAPPAA